MPDLDLSKAIEAGARELACLDDGEPWPSNADLGGNLTGTRDDEYRDGITEHATEIITAALPHILDALAEQAEANHAEADDTYQRMNGGYVLWVKRGRTEAVRDYLRAKAGEVRE